MLVIEVDILKTNILLLRNVVVPVLLVNFLFNLQLSDFFDFVMVNCNGFVFVLLTVQGDLSSIGAFWLVEHNVGVWRRSAWVLALDALDCTELFEDLLKLGLLPARWEVADIQVLSFNGVSSIIALFGAQLGSGFLWDELLDNNLGANNDLVAVHLCDASSHCLLSVLLVFAGRVRKHDVSILSFVTFVHNKLGDLSEFLEQRLDLSLCHGKWDEVEVNLV